MHSTLKRKIPRAISPQTFTDSKIDYGTVITRRSSEQGSDTWAGLAAQWQSIRRGIKRLWVGILISAQLFFLFSFFLQNLYCHLSVVCPKTSPSRSDNTTDFSIKHTWQGSLGSTKLTVQRINPKSQLHSQLPLHIPFTHARGFIREHAGTIGKILPSKKELNLMQKPSL